MKLLDELEQLAPRYGRGVARHKLALLAQLDETPSARALSRLHELLLILRAFPDDEAVLARVDAMLAGFAERRDVERLGGALADTGIAGTRIHFRFYCEMAAWLCQRWPDAIHIDWAEVDDDSLIDSALPLLVLYGETPAIDTMVQTTREWFDTFKGPAETDAAFLIRRFATLPSGIREAFYDILDVPLCLEPRPDTPSRTRALHRWHAPVFQRRPRSRRRPNLKRAARQPPLSVQHVDPGEGDRLVDLAREAMVTRHRDLDGIQWADPNDAHLFDAGGGLSFAALGLRPERRFMLECVYVFLILQNGVPIGYFQAAMLFGAAELNYNVFPPWRGAGAAEIYARGVALVHHWLGADVFAVDPYQLGNGNREALESGAFWFYYKLGFRPEDVERKRVVTRELRSMKRDAKHRSSRATLRELSHEYLYFYLNERRDDVGGKLAYGRIGLAVARHVAERFGADREAAASSCAAEAGRLLDVDPATFDEYELIAWQRWSPLVMVLDVAGWSRGAKRALVAVIRAKGGAAERDYVRLFDAHSELRAALARLATPP